MQNLKNIFGKLKMSYLQVASILLLGVLAIGLLWFNSITSLQAEPAMIAQVYFEGKYKIGDGEWQDIQEGKHIPSTQGDVTLRGNFHMLTPYGDYVGIYRGDAPIALYTNHIGVTVCEEGFEPFVIDTENPLYGSSMCGAQWTGYMLMSESDQLVDIIIHNPHVYGNELAVDELIAGVAIWGDMEFEKGVFSKGEPQRNAGMLMMLVSVVFLGIALFSSLIHIKNSRIVWLLGLMVLFAGVYLAYSADGVSFWSESIVTNTTMLGLSMMFYMLFMSASIGCMLRLTRKVGNITVLAIGIANAVFCILPMLTGISFYNTWIFWIAIQLVASGVLIVCILKELTVMSRSEFLPYVGALIPLIAFPIDVIGTYLGLWQGGVISKYVFIILFAVAAVIVLRLIPNSINATAKARELEIEKMALNAQLADSRISTMMSQIRPHFIYNTLGSIEQLCKLDPPKAGELVHNFAKYLRGNFGELDNPKPILMSQEMAHVHHYISIENVRFPDMTFTFEMNSDDFHLPALSVQPIVENAIKHGLMRLPKGGTINVVSYETESHYCVSVTDDGVGFDTGALMDERKHVGLRNIRERLKVMVDGTLEIESTPGVGTKVVIRIPKEVG